MLVEAMAGGKTSYDRPSRPNMESAAALAGDQSIREKTWTP